MPSGAFSNVYRGWIGVLLTILLSTGQSPNNENSAFIPTVLRTKSFRSLRHMLDGHTVILEIQVG